MKLLFLDTETTGVCNMRTTYNEETLKTEWPYITQFTWQMVDYNETFTAGEQSKLINAYVKPSYPKELYQEGAQQVTGISYEFLLDKTPIAQVIEEFLKAFNECDAVVAHNSTYDMKIIKAELMRLHIDLHLRSKPWLDTMYYGTEFLKKKTGRGKWPKLSELYHAIYGHIPDGLHNSISDVNVLKDCFNGLVLQGVLSQERINLKVQSAINQYKAREGVK